jgi:hypothetical protein
VANRSTAGGGKSQSVKGLNGRGGGVIVEAVEPVVGVAEVLVFP